MRFIICDDLREVGIVVKEYKFLEKNIYKVRK